VCRAATGSLQVRYARVIVTVIRRVSVDREHGLYLKLTIHLEANDWMDGGETIWLASPPLLMPRLILPEGE